MKPIDFEIEDLPDELRHIADLIGIHLTKKLMVEFAGDSIRFPVHYPPAIIKRFINSHYDGHNADALGKQLGMSRQSIFRYLNEKIRIPSVQNIPVLKSDN